MEAKRNSFLELFRFIFSLFILFYHNLFFVKIPIFENANFVLDFFFMLSGLFMVQTLKKYDELKFFEGLKQLLKDRLKNLWIALAIACAFLIVGWCIESETLFKPHLLWFVFFLLIIYIVYYIIRRVVKKNNIFIIVVVILGIIAAILRFSSIIVISNESFNDITDTLFHADELRGVWCVPIGMLIGFIPDIKEEKAKRNDIISLILCISLILIGFALYTTTINLQVRAISELVLDLVAFPGILYVSRYYKFNNNVINLLGTLSIYIYIYQQIPNSICAVGIENQFLKFLMVLVPVLIHLYFLVKAEKKKRHKHQKVVQY